MFKTEPLRNLITNIEKLLKTESFSTETCITPFSKVKLGIKNQCFAH